MSSILQLSRPVTFDATNTEHRKSYVSFLTTSKWTLRFELEFPFTTLPSMVMYKLAIQACASEGIPDMSEQLSKSAYVQPEHVGNVHIINQPKKAA